ncbi:MAG: zeta toxin family protein, partial [Helicobacteraceae bacterium]|nr:zeta toxin family protein [Helicobacteraceae bacterium]
IPIGDSRPTSAETQKDAGTLANKLRALAIADRQNVVEEGTFRDSETLKERIEALRKLGYTIEILAIATPKEESRLGIFQRYETQHTAKVKNPRFVSVEFHDMAMEGFDKSLQKCQALVDRIRVINRSGEILFDSASPKNRQASAYEAIAEGRKMSSQKLAKTALSWQEVKKMAIERNAPQEYLKEIDAQIKHIDNLCRDKMFEKSRNCERDEGLMR